MAAVRAYAEAHRAAFSLPGMTIGLTVPGWSGTIEIGFANADSRTPVLPDTRFQIGSITKLTVAIALHQMVAEGKFALTDPIATLLPSVPVPKKAGITVQQLLDHTSGLPGDAPLFPEGGLWTGFAPGTYWSYSNTGYDILGKLAEHVDGKPLARILQNRVFGPLSMARTRGAITSDERALQAQGYEQADSGAPFARGSRLAPASWVDVTFGAGSVVSTAADMNLLLRALADAVKGSAAAGLSAERARAYANHSAPTDGPGMRYGNGIMHVANGPRNYLHHTGGMVSFSSAFHVDTASGAGAFASTNLSGLAGYRPRLITRYAADALTEAMAGRPLPAGPRIDEPLRNPAQYIGSYSGPGGELQVAAGAPLSISANGKTATLQPVGGDLFRTTHPDFDDFTLKIERSSARVTGISWGSRTYLRAGSPAKQPGSDPALARLAGRYVNDSPWWGVMNVVERGGKLWIGTETAMTPIGDNLWRVGEDRRSPERGSFRDVIDGRPQTFMFSGEKFVRHDV